MTRKDAFLRAIQSQPLSRAADLPFSFGLALNLAENSIPADLAVGARRFVAEVASVPLVSPAAPGRRPQAAIAID